MQNGDERSNFSLLTDIWGYLPARRRMQGRLLVGFMVLTSFAEVFSIAAIFPFLKVLTEPGVVFEVARLKPLIDALGVTQPDGLRAPITLVFCAAVLFSGGMRIGLAWLSARISEGAGADIRSLAFERTLYQPYAVHISRNSSEVIAAVIQKTQVLISVMFAALSLVSSVLIGLALSATLILIDPVVTITGVASIGLFYLVIAYSTKRVFQRNSRCVAQETNVLLRVVQEALGGIRDVIIDGSQKMYLDHYCASEFRLRRASASNRVLQSTPRNLIEAIGVVAIACLAFAMVAQRGSAESAIATLGALALGVQKLLPLMQQIFASWSMVQGSRRAITDSLEYLDQRVPDHARIPVCEVEPISFAREIRFEDVCFRYTTETPMVLKGINLTVRRGERIGVMGRTGGGKSTFLDLLMGLLEPTSGGMYVDDQKIEPRQHRAWQRHIAHVPQSIFLTDASIAENIALGVPPRDIDLQRVRWAAQKADIAEAVEKFSEGYDTRVGERGVYLSGGQRQRVGIARALYKSADVIVLDEATSALDNGTEQSVMQSINSLDGTLTIFIVAHRLTTLTDCDRIIEIADGRVARVGTYAEMVEGAAVKV